MEYNIKYQPSYAMLVVDLKENEGITGEAGAMTYMSPTIGRADPGRSASRPPP